MNAQDLLNHYARISESPDAIPKLRSFVLDLAVRGKLTAPDLHGRSVQSLIDAFQIAKAKAGKASVLLELTPEESPFELPRNWAWTRVGEICLQTGSGSTPRGGKSAYVDEGILFLRSQNIYDDGLRLSDVAYIPDETHQKMARTAVRADDLLLNITGGSIGRCALVPSEFDTANVSQHVSIVRCGLAGYHSYLHVVIQSPYFQKFIFDEQNGAGREGLPKKKMDLIPIPLPPDQTQYEIVAKVDELMALCDQLEQARAGREAVRDRLTTASLARLTAPGTGADTFQSHARFALQSLPTLTTRPDQIKTLRQTILNLAVRGKLVAQNGEDEPAAELLKRFKAGKDALKKETGDARIKLAPDATRENYPLELPLGWEVQSFENLFLFIDYRGNTPPKTERGVPLITAKNVRMGALNREPREYISEQTFENWMTRGFPRLGDLFFTTEAPLANVCVNDIEEPFALAQRVICFQPYATIDTRYLMLALTSEVMQALIDGQATGMTAKGIKAAKLKPLPIPLPPLAEQHRIVAKVDALMVLCDQLEASLTTTTTTRSKLLNALLNEALAANAKAKETAE